MPEGIDVHGSKGAVDWNRVRAAGRSFAWVKATEGATFHDERLRQNLTGARLAGLAVGPYHYARPDLRASFSGGVLEARVFIRAILEAGWNKKTDLLPVLDLEEGHDVNEYVAGFTSWVENDLGVAPVIYSYPHFINSYVRDKSFARYPLWLAAYGDNDDVRESAPPKVAVWGNNWTAHQYSSNGSVPGVAGRCDLNYAPSVEVLYATKRETEKDDWPRPIPKWFWEWAAWKLGGEAWLRPETAPRLIPLWAWRRLRALLRARNK